MRGGPLILGITGGIATGKSTFAGLLAERLPGSRAFGADACVSRLLDRDPRVASRIRGLLGPEAYAPDGTANRGEIRGRIFCNETLREALEAILHPPARAALLRTIRACRREGRFLVAEIPLLFEVGWEGVFDGVITVAASGTIQRRRACARPGMTPALAKKMIASQWPLGEKMRLSHHVVWNDGSLEALSAQADFLSTLFHV